MQQKEDRIGPQSQLEAHSMVVARADEYLVVPVEKQVVTTRPDQNIYQQYGRDSVYAFSPDRKPQKPEQTGSRG